MDTGYSAKRKKEHIPYGTSLRYDRTWDTMGWGRGQHEPTIRTVTPESIPEHEMLTKGYIEGGLTASSSPGSPKSSTRDSPGTAIRGLLPRSESYDSDVRSKSARDPGTRPWTGTLDDTSGDGSPSAPLVKSRHRLGSVHSISSSVYQSLEETVNSIGHPSTVSSSPSRATRHRLVKRPPRAASPLQYTTTHSNPAAPVLPPTDSRKILHLMRSTCGRMEGMLAFRRGETNPWSLSFCHINDELGSLVYEPRSDSSYHRTLISDLRGCKVKTAFDTGSRAPYLVVSAHNSKLEVHLRAHTQDEHDSWFAALLCWQPIRPKGIQNRVAKPQVPLRTEQRPNDGRRHSEVTLLTKSIKEAPVIKVGKMIFWDTHITYSNAGTPKTGQPAAYRVQSFGSRRWRRVSCTLRESGELKLYSDTDNTLVSVVQLSQLSRCAIQRLDPSVLDDEFCIAIFPQYTATSTSLALLRPIFISLESRVLYEVWVVLLRAFTIPELYGPEQSFFGDDLDPPAATQSQQTTSTAGMFRMERSLSLAIVEARILPPVAPKVSEQNTGGRPSSTPDHQSGGYYIEVLLDGETRARTMVKSEPLNPFWREEFDVVDLPAVLSAASFVLKKRPPSRAQDERSMHEQTKIMHDALGSSDSVGGNAGISFDQTSGKVDIYLDELESGKELEKWWPLVNMYGHKVGEVLLRLRADEGVILMARDYQPMSELLHRFSNGLTLQIAQMVPNDLRRVSECLLNIFQVSGQASDWLTALVEEEIDGTLKETPASRLRFSGRAGSNESNDSFGSAPDRELFVRDLGKSAMLEANLLFRGNTLLTKALDSHMKRLGKEYLEDTLGDKLKEISDKDPECEVDPNRIQSSHDLEKHWRKLISLTDEIWKCIYNSASRCPPELRVVFRHIRACAEDRYGDFLRTVSYSSVSGFLFLRFFCPAVLNPKLFGLLRDHPKPRARRTLTLVAKSLQGLANLSTFGVKEHWMEPMNAFLSSHRQQFKTFIDAVCNTPAAPAVLPIPPPYSTPLAILQRLPPTSREGFPSLPYLIDHAHNFAVLVRLWLDGTRASAVNIQASDGDLLEFHRLCVALDRRTKECLESAERAERPSGRLSARWEELVERLEREATLKERPVPEAGRAVPRAREARLVLRPGVERTFSSGGEGSAAPAVAAAVSHPRPGTTAAAPASRSAASASASASAFPTPYASASADADANDNGNDDDASRPTPTHGGGGDEDEEDEEEEIDEDDASPPAGSAAGTARSPASSARGMSSGVSSDAEGTTALPRMRGRAERDGERERERGVFGVLVPGFKKKREKGRERVRGG